MVQYEVDFQLKCICVIFLNVVAFFLMDNHMDLEKMCLSNRQDIKCTATNI